MEVTGRTGQTVSLPTAMMSSLHTGSDLWTLIAALKSLNVGPFSMCRYLHDNAIRGGACMPRPACIANRRTPTSLLDFTFLCGPPNVPRPVDVSSRVTSRCIRRSRPLPTSPPRGQARACARTSHSSSVLLCPSCPSYIHALRTPSSTRHASVLSMKWCS